MKIPYQRIQNFRLAAANYLNINKEAKTTKFNYALQKMISITKEFEKKVQEDVEDKQTELASEDEQKNLLRGPNNEFKYTKENQKTLTSFLRDILKREFEVEPYFAKDEPQLTFQQREAFTGFVLEEKEDEPSQPEESPVNANP